MEKFQGTRRRNGKAKTVSFVVLNIVQSTVQKRYLITTVRTYFRSETQTLYPGLIYLIPPSHAFSLLSRSPFEVSVVSSCASGGCRDGGRGGGGGGNLFPSPPS